MIHRAILGSLERIMGILMEHTGGRWPFWLSPRQVAVVNVSDAHAAYARQVQQRLQQLGYHAETDLARATLNKKIRTAQLAQTNYILVVGDAEVAAGTVHVRARDGTDLGAMSLAALEARFASESLPPGITPDTA